MQHFFLLFIPGILGGMINAIAGGGGIVMYPALLATGLNPIVANATASLVVLPGSVTSAVGYRKDLQKISRYYYWLVAPCFFGAVIGSYVLVHTKPTTFEQLAPWLVLSAVVLLALQSRIHRWLTQQSKKRKIHWHTLPLLCTAALPLAIYAGFFGVGFGLMMLALLGFTALKSVYQMNGLKNICGIVIASVSVVYFTRTGFIHWESGLMMAVGTSIGGYVGSRLSHKISAHLVHDITVAIGLLISMVLIAQQY